MKSIARKKKKHNTKNTVPALNVLRCSICGHETDPFDLPFHIALTHQNEYASFLKGCGLEVAK